MVAVFTRNLKWRCTTAASLPAQEDKSQQSKPLVFWCENLRFSPILLQAREVCTEGAKSEIKPRPSPPSHRHRHLPPCHRRCPCHPPPRPPPLPGPPPR